MLRRLLPIVLLWLCLVGGSLFAAGFTVTVAVVDSDKKPVPNADLALFWQVKEGMNPIGDQRAVTGDNGKAVLQVGDQDAKRAVLILSADRKLGSVLAISNLNPGVEISAQLLPTVRVKGRLECKELNSKPEWANTMVTPDGFDNPIAQNMGASAQFDFTLPAGKYDFRSYGSDVMDRKQSVTLPAGRLEYDFGTVDLKPSAIAKLKGKTAPGWDVTAARGIKPKAKLADFRGKWLYLEFWGFW